MINLLPQEEKNILKSEEISRLCLIWSIFVLFFLITLSLILFSVKTYVFGEVESQKILIDQEQQKSQTLAAQNLEQEIILVNQELLKINSFYKEQPNFTELFKKISSYVPQEIYLNSMSLERRKGDSGGFQLSLTGNSQTRESLLEFKSNLESDSKIQGVYFPPSSWVKPEDINFSASFEIAI